MTRPFSSSGLACRFVRAFLSSLCALWAAVAQAGDPPHLDPAGREAYRTFLGAEAHRAFAISPGGRWGWSASAASAESAGEQALAYCQERNIQRCVLYAVDDAEVFAAKAWVALWGPYANAATAARAPTGLQRGMRFPDLALTDPAGRKMKLSDARGEVVILHFWGSWCGVCRKEMPEMQAAAAKLGSTARFILIQVREDVAESRRWLKRQAIRLPLYDSGAHGSSDGVLRLAGGGGLNDRDLAKAFPTTYVLDRHGLVLFSHTGALHGWSEYIPFLRHAAQGGE